MKRLRASKPRSTGGTADWNGEAKRLYAFVMCWLFQDDVWLNLNNRPTGVFILVRGELNKLTPASIFPPIPKEKTNAINKDQVFGTTNHSRCFLF
ncbi:hypothetical protein AB6A23_03865 [Paenibacillus tarimensis]